MGFIFAKTLDKLVATGSKTQTRRPVKDGNYCICDDNGQIIEVYNPSGRLKWKVGRNYAIVPGRGKHGLKTHRIRITRIREQPLHEITEEDARAEGFKHVAEFLQVWRDLYGNWQPDVYVVDFEVYEVADAQVR